MTLILSVLVAGLGLGCGDKDDTGTDGGASDGGTADGGTSDGGSAECDTTNEDCGPGTCDGDGGEMLPGADCMACHTPETWPEGGEEDEAMWTVAGTAFADADGTGPLVDAIVRITDANGDTEVLHTNDVGNFYSRANLVPPLSAEIEVGGDILTMSSTVDTGACNACHACEGEAGGKLYGP